MRIWTLAATAGFALALSSSGASSRTPVSAPPPEAIGAVLACRSVTTAEMRVACYDRAATALDAAIAKKDVVVFGSADVRQARRSLFGFSFPKLPFLGDSSDNRESQEIVSKVVSARSLGYGKWRVQIEDGALWETTEGLDEIQVPGAGDSVRIHKAALGSYFMNIAGARGVRARRIS